MILRVKNWDAVFENAASRKLVRLAWVPVPNKMDGEGYTSLVDHPNGAAHLGAWLAIMEIASKQEPRTARGTLPGGPSHDLGMICRSLGRISRLPAAIFEEVLPRLMAAPISWLEVLSNEQSATPSGESASISGESPERIEQKRTEIEENPLPPDGGGKSPDATTPTDQQPVVRPAVPTEEKPKSGAALAADAAVTAAAARIWGRHPGPRRDTSANAVAKALTKILRHKNVTMRNVPEMVEEIDRVHAAWCATEGWQKDGGEFAKGLDNWLAPTKDRYEAAPVVSIARPAYTPPSNLYSLEKVEAERAARRKLMEADEQTA